MFFYNKNLTVKAIYTFLAELVPRDVQPQSKIAFYYSFVHRLAGNDEMVHPPRKTKTVSPQFQTAGHHHSFGRPITPNYEMVDRHWHGYIVVSPHVVLDIQRTPNYERVHRQSKKHRF